MKNYILPLALSIVLYSCGNSYDKSPEDWSKEICDCAHEKGIDAKECHEMYDELDGYYAEEDYSMHDKATHLISLDCPDFIGSVVLRKAE